MVGKSASPLVEIGLTDLPKSGFMTPPAPSGTTPLHPPAPTALGGKGHNGINGMCVGGTRSYPFIGRKETSPMENFWQEKLGVCGKRASEYI